MIAPEDLIAEFSQLMIEQDYASAEALLAPWVRAGLPAGGLRKLVRVAAGDDTPAAEFESMLISDSEVSSIDNAPAEVTDTNFLGSYQIDFITEVDLGDDAEVVFSLMVSVVADDGIGSLAVVD